MWPERVTAASHACPRTAHCDIHHHCRIYHHSFHNTSLLTVPGLHSQCSHVSCECLYWKISCLSTWQTSSFLSQRELKINSLMPSQSVSTSMRDKQANVCCTGRRIFKCGHKAAKLLWKGQPAKHIAISAFHNDFFPNKRKHKYKVCHVWTHVFGTWTNVQ